LFHGDARSTVTRRRGARRGCGAPRAMRYVRRAVALLATAEAASEEPAMFKRIKFVGIPVRDQDQALEFWTRKLGLQVVTDQPMGPGQRWIELKIPGAQTGLALFTPPGHESRIGTFQSLSFEVDDVEKSHRELSALGVELAQPPKKEQWGTSAIFKDPDGNSFVMATR
jgi:catechol 2,3-dioxygenase-like lactoylglutathione lyase family enzyme